MAAIALRKAQVELELLERQLTPEHRRREWIQSIVSASGLVVVLVSVLSALGSGVAWLTEQSAARQERFDKRYTDFLSGLAADKPGSRTIVVTQLRSFIEKSDPERNAQVLAAFANALPLETDEVVRGAMVSAFEDIDIKTVGPEAARAALKTLAVQSRSKLNTSRAGQSGDVASEQDALDLNKLESLGDAMAALLRKGVRTDAANKVQDLSGVYLAGVDLHGVDLHNTVFNGAVLRRANFKGSMLANASFNGADLESVQFDEANLHGAKLTLRNQEDGSPPRYNYVERAARASAGPIPRIDQPSFRCAVLRNADFSGLPTFGWGYATGRPISGKRVDFRGADLTGADFTHVGYYTIIASSAQNDGPLAPVVANAHWKNSVIDDGVTLSVSEALTQEEFGREIPGVSADGLKKFQMDVGQLQQRFSGASWQAANLPPDLAGLLAASPFGDAPPADCTPPRVR